MRLQRGRGAAGQGRGHLAASGPLRQRGGNGAAAQRRPIGAGAPAASIETHRYAVLLRGAASCSILLAPSYHLSGNGDGSPAGRGTAKALSVSDTME